MAYVMLSRVQNISQLFILEDLPEKAFRTNSKCLSELERLTNISVNKNPPLWEKNILNNLKIAVLNCHSILDKIEHIKADRTIWFADVVCLSETWLKNDEMNEQLNLPGFSIAANSYGAERGKGILTYFKPEVFSHQIDIKERDVQITLISSQEMDIISVYRSSSNKSLIKHLSTIINPQRPVLICGDFNFCYKEQNQNNIAQFLKYNGFSQHVLEATHIDGGHLDQVYFKDESRRTAIDVLMYSPYYTAKDHDALLLTLMKDETVEMSSTDQTDEF